MNDTIRFWQLYSPDKQYGGFLTFLDADGTVSSTLKGNMWKGPFHLSRMQLNCWQLLEEIKTTQLTGGKLRLMQLGTGATYKLTVKENAAQQQTTDSNGMITFVLPPVDKNEEVMLSCIRE